jgi:enoyl-CoA hydratase/carnithine racemase
MEAVVRYGWVMSLVLVDVADGVATLTLNNPAERNTLTAATLTAAPHHYGDGGRAMMPRIVPTTVAAAARRLCAGAPLCAMAPVLSLIIPRRISATCIPRKHGASHARP